MRMHWRGVKLLRHITPQRRITCCGPHQPYHPDDTTESRHDAVWVFRNTGSPPLPSFVHYCCLEHWWQRALECSLRTYIAYICTHVLRHRRMEAVSKWCVKLVAGPRVAQYSGVWLRPGRSTFKYVFSHEVSWAMSQPPKVFCENKRREETLNATLSSMVKG